MNERNSSAKRLFLTLLFFILIGIGIFTGLKDRENTPIRQPTQNEEILTQDDIKILILGDSITAGYGLSPNDSFPAQLESLLTSKGYPVKIINAGVSGDTSQGGLERTPFAINQRPQIIIIALGGNDMLRGIPPATTRENLEKMIQLIQAENTQIILAGMRAPANMGLSYVQEFNRIFPDLAKKYNVTFVPFLLEGVALNPEKNQDDSIHPNAEGSRIIAQENIYPKLTKVLNQILEEI